MPLTTKHLVQLIAAIIFFFSCSKKENKTPVISVPDVASVNSLSIPASKNSNFTIQDIAATISHDSIQFSLPQSVSNSAFYLSYKIEGDSLFYQNTFLDSSQQSQLVNNAIIKVKAHDGTIASYKLIINYYDEKNITFTSYNITKGLNSSINSDIAFSISNDTIYGTLAQSDSVLIPTFTATAASVQINNQIQTSAKTAVNFLRNTTYTLISTQGIKKNFYISITWINTSLPQLVITTENNAAITSKDDYINATLKITGNTYYSDYQGTTKIRGRGNSTWGYPKKPYRLKLDKKASLLGLAEEKDWVLLANYQDGAGLCNMVASKVGEYVSLPYTNHMIPVEVTLNGSYQGLYLFTEQVEIDDNRINIGDDGLLLELDSYYDETWKFKSKSYQLPVNVKAPDLTTSTELSAIQTEFNAMESLISSSSFPNNNFGDKIDLQSLEKFLIPFLLCDNEEINHPKSVYVYKATGGKYTFGPIWDFDWAYGYEKSNSYFSPNVYSQPLFWSTSPAPKAGTYFFSKLASSPVVKQAIIQEWSNFKSTKLTQLLSDIDIYANQVKAARVTDYNKWQNGSSDFSGSVTRLKTWLTNRANYLDTYLKNL